MQAQAQQAQQSAVEALSQTDKQSSESSSEYVSQLSSGSRVNVAVSSTDSGVSASLETFSSLNTQVQATQAYSN